MSRVLPILFNSDMVRAILEGRKTVTRRIVKFIDGKNPNWTGYEKCGLVLYNGRNEPCNKKPPYQVGDILYVRETWFYEMHMHDRTDGEPDLPGGRYSHRYIYKADSPDYPVDMGVGGTGWRPSIHMPKEAARIWLKVTDVRVERLKEISNEQVLKEGVSRETVSHYMGQCPEETKEWERAAHIIPYSELWDSTIKKSDLDRYGWNVNPWVWVIEFERCAKPEGVN